MKLGTETGSVINWMMGGTNGQPEPVVGMGVTFLHWTDRSAGTIVEFDGKTMTVQGDKATRIDSNGMSDAQSYRYEPNLDAHKITYRKDAKGRWHSGRINPATNRWNFTSKGSQRPTLNVRDAHYDYSF